MHPLCNISQLHHAERHLPSGGCGNGCSAALDDLLGRRRVAWGRLRVLRVCEVNMQDPSVSVALLLRTFRLGLPNISYTALDFGDPTRSVATFVRAALPCVRLLPARATNANPRKQARWSNETVARTIRRNGLRRGGCDLVIANADDDWPEGRQTVLFDLQRLLPLASSAIMLHGRKSCRRELYLGSNFKFWPEECWVDRWKDLVAERMVTRSRCRDDLGGTVLPGDGLHAASGSPLAQGPRPWRRWCIGDVEHSSSCSPAVASSHSWAHPVLATPSRCVPAEPLTFAPSSRAWHKPRYGVPSLRHLQNRHFRYYSVVECRGGITSSGSGNASRGNASRDSVARERRSKGRFDRRYSATVKDASASMGAVCLLWKDDVYESWVGGLSSADGVHFAGDPRLVVPREMVRVVRRRGSTLASLDGVRQPPSDAEGAGGAVGAPESIGAPDGPGGPVGAMPQSAVISMSHNFGILAHGGEFFFVGGTVSRRKRTGNGSHVGGIWLARSPSWHMAAAESAGPTAPSMNATAANPPPPHAVQWDELRRILTGRHAGCVERRDPSRMTWLVPNACEYDGA